MGNVIFDRIFTLIFAYFIGALFQAGYWMGKFQKIDIRDYGSGNAGTTNVMRTLGKKAGFTTYFIDMLKALLSLAIIHFFLVPNSEVPEMLLALYSGLGVILGHNFPFYLKFKGGKGIAATSGVVISFAIFPNYCFVFTIVGFISFFVILFTTKYVSLGSLIGTGSFCVCFFLWGFLGFLPSLTGAFLIEAYVVVFVITAFAFIRHHENIKRLLNGTERKMGQKKA